MLKNGAIGVRKCPPSLKSHLDIYKRNKHLETHPGQKGGGKGEKGSEMGARGRTGGGEKDRARGNAGGCPKALRDASECLCGVPG